MPFTHCTLTAEKPPPDGYPENPETLGARLRQARMDRGLRQKEVAEELGVHPDTVKNWENGRSEPTLKAVPKVLEFLGDFTLESPVIDENFTGWFTLERRKAGLSQQEVAERLGVTEKTVRSWERGEHRPSPEHLERLEAWFASPQTR